MKSKILAAMLAAGAVVALAPSASAQTLTFTGTNGVFSNSQVTSPSFTDNYNFVLAPGSYKISGTLSASAFNASQLINFTGVSLNGTPFTLSSVSAGSATFTFGYVADVLSQNPNILSISGTAGNSAGYSGTLTIAAVPEPAAWAMMVGGFAVMGLAVRSRRRKLAVAAA